MRKINGRLRQVIENLKSNTYKEHIEIMESLPLNFIEVHDCVLLREVSDLPELNMEFILKQFGDRTGFEAADSHVHMIDISRIFVDDPFEGLIFAIRLTNFWSRRLKFEFPNYRFIIYLTFHGVDTIIRFHKLREEEPTWIDIERIDEYKDEGIMIQLV